MTEQQNCGKSLIFLAQYITVVLTPASSQERYEDQIDHLIAIYIHTT